VRGIADLEREVFGPVLHIATFRAEAIDAVIAEINATGYGLTFGLHTRIDTRVEEVARDIRAGNVYVNRNQIGAVVGSQPFGGTGLSGTGPKAGGPAYVERFCREPRGEAAEAPGRRCPA
jgi:RHH-type proline utilization regulon transcriptional repressor/proline dehydrogenase/delta 1-pyrroline-5-carboxylate dehydrogenase